MSRPDPNRADPINLSAPTPATVERVYALVEKRSAELEEANAKLALAQARLRVVEADNDLRWGQICDTMEALGCIVPESAPHSVSWAQKIRAQMDADRELLGKACRALRIALDPVDPADRGTIRDVFDALQQRIDG